MRLRALRLSRRSRIVAVSGAVLATARVGGLVSQLLVVGTFGASSRLDGFYLALLVPTLIAVPVAATAELALAPLASRLRDAPRRAAAVARDALAASGAAGLALSVVLVVASPVLVRASSPGAPEAVLSQARAVAPYLYPTVAFTILAGIASALLIGRALVQIPPVLQMVRPLAMIAVVVIVAAPTVRDLSMAVLAASAIEAAAALIVVRVVHGPMLRAGSSGVDYRQAAREGRPVVLNSVVGQATPVIDQSFAASLGSGALVILVLATRFYDVAKTFLIVPAARLAQHDFARAHDDRSFAAVLQREQRRAITAGGISGLLLAAIAPLVLLGLYTNGEFTSADAWEVAGVTGILALGLVPFALATLLPRALIARGAASRVTKTLLVYLVCNVVLDAVLVRAAGVPGIAIATVVSLVVLLALQRRAVSNIPAGLRVAPHLEDQQRPEDSGRPAPSGVEPLA